MYQRRQATKHDLRVLGRRPVVIIISAAGRAPCTAVAIVASRSSAMDALEFLSVYLDFCQLIACHAFQRLRNAPSLYIHLFGTKSLPHVDPKSQWTILSSTAEAR